MTDREKGRTTRSWISSAEAPTLEMMKPAFCGSMRHITFTSIQTLLPSLVLKVMSSGTGRSISFTLAFIIRFCCEMGRVCQEFTTGSITKMPPGS